MNAMIWLFIISVFATGFDVRGLAFVILFGTLYLASVIEKGFDRVIESQSEMDKRQHDRDLSNEIHEFREHQSKQPASEIDDSYGAF